MNSSSQGASIFFLLQNQYQGNIKKNEAGMT